MGEKIMKTFMTVGDKVEELVERYLLVSQHRDPRLFKEFLVHGYRQTTLSSVAADLTDEVIYGKVCLGMIITLYDDLADNPLYYNPKLLKTLYRLNLNDISHSLVEVEFKDFSIYELAIHLFSELSCTLNSFPHYEKLKDILSFDIQHVFLANQYAELLTANPDMRNLQEGQYFGPYNMGMIAAGIIDLMASPDCDFSELGKIRQILIKGQRVGRIGNLLSTFKRELYEGDVTNEMLLNPSGIEIAQGELKREMYKGISEILNQSKGIKGINLIPYANGLSDLFDLHIRMEGII
jgi:hypothetical protein